MGLQLTNSLDFRNSTRCDRTQEQDYDSHEMMKYVRDYDRFLRYRQHPLLSSTDQRLLGRMFCGNFSLLFICIVVRPLMPFVVVVGGGSGRAVGKYPLNWTEAKFEIICPKRGISTTICQSNVFIVSVSAGRVSFVQLNWADAQVRVRLRGMLWDTIGSWKWWLHIYVQCSRTNGTDEAIPTNGKIRRFSASLVTRTHTPVARSFPYFICVQWHFKWTRIGHALHSKRENRTKILHKIFHFLSAKLKFRQTSVRSTAAYWHLAHAIFFVWWKSGEFKWSTAMMTTTAAWKIDDKSTIGKMKL